MFCFGRVELCVERLGTKSFKFPAWGSVPVIFISLILPAYFMSCLLYMFRQSWLFHFIISNTAFNLCSHLLVCNERPVSPIYCISQFEHGIVYTIPVCFSIGTLSLTFVKMFFNLTTGFSATTKLCFWNNLFNLSVTLRIYGNIIKPFRSWSSSPSGLLSSRGFVSNTLLLCFFKNSIGYPLLSNTLFICFTFNLLFNGFAETFAALEYRDLATAALWWIGWCESKCKYLSVYEWVSYKPIYQYGHPPLLYLKYPNSQSVWMITFNCKLDMWVLRIQRA